MWIKRQKNMNTDKVSDLWPLWCIVSTQQGHIFHEYRDAGQGLRRISSYSCSMSIAGEAERFGVAQNVHELMGMLFGQNYSKRPSCHWAHERRSWQYGRELMRAEIFTQWMSSGGLAGPRVDELMGGRDENRFWFKRPYYEWAHACGTHHATSQLPGLPIGNRCMS